MGFTPNFTNTLLLLTIIVVLLPVETYAFGAGDIPDFAYLNDKAFRHGDIENILETLVKSAGGAAIGGGAGGLLGFASSVIKHVKGGAKFNKSDIKKVYFGNWLRDYSQAMDIAGLSKLSADTLILVVSVLGFMTFGFASEEYEITADRLGVYLPVEHIDNPKGYAEAEGDARSFHPKLRPPVNPRELEIDSNTGMKKYIATEGQGWDTSTAFIRRTFKACIEAGRRSNGKENADLWEAYRLLGTGLHTMEDLLAHSNWCEIALRKLGHKDVFCHVGDRVTVNTPNGVAPPLVTGTFGSADFLHSLLGEAGDKLSQASVTDLSQKMSGTSPNKGPDIGALKSFLSKFGGGNEGKLDQGEDIKKQSQGYNFDPDNVCPPDVQKKLLDLLKWHDDIMRNIIKRIEMVPGLTNLLDEFSNDLNEYIYTILAPYLGPILTQATSALNEGSKAVIDTDDQYEVFNNPNAHDPSHSLLSKDHFGLILNEPAGKIAQILVENSVNLIVPAWNDNSDPDQVIDQILEAFHHPYYATGRSRIQEKMFDHMRSWLGGLGNEANEIISLLTKESVRNHKNKRPGLAETEEAGYGGCGHGYKPANTPAKKPAGVSSNTYGQNTSSHAAGYAAAGATAGYAAQNTYNAGQSHGQTQRRDEDDNRYGGHQQPQRQSNTSSNQGRDDTPSYGNQRRDDTPSYGGQRRDENPSYGGNQRRDDYSSGATRRDETPAYGGRRNDDDDNKSSGRQQGGQSGYGAAQQSGGYAPSYGQSTQSQQSGGYAPSYGQSQPQTGGYTPSYGGRKTEEDDNSRGYGKKSSKRDDDSDDDKRRKHEQPSYGQKKRDDSDDDKKYKPSYGGGQNRKDDSDDDRKSKPSYGGGRSKKDDSDSDDDRKKGYGKHGSRQDDDKPSYNQPGRGGYGGQQDGGDRYGQGRGGNDGQQGRGGYGGQNDDNRSGHGQSGRGGYGGRDETFGVEQLNIGRHGGGRRGDDDDDDNNRRQGRSGEERGGYGGRQGGGYGGGY